MFNTTTRSRPFVRGLVLFASAGLTLLIPASAQQLDDSPEFSNAERAYFEVFLSRESYAAGSNAKAAGLMTIHPEWHTNSHEPTYDYLIATEVELEMPPRWSAATISYPPGHMATFAFADEPLSVYEGEALIHMDLVIPDDAAGTFDLPASLTYQACNDRSCLAPVTTTAQVSIDVGEEGAAINQAFFDRPPTTQHASATTAGATTGTTSLAWMLLFGVIGGLILNAMPCVLPVLSLKVFSLIRDSDQGSAQVRRGALATAAGILVSFWALAAVAILARSAGRAVGWGVQFQDPTFVAALALIVVLFCLNLWGLFEIVLPSSLLTRIGTAQTQQHGLGGHFVAGMFTTLMATPCSAPFLGTAVGFALAQPPLIVLGIFTAVGVGMALPYIALLIAPGLARFLPRPGAWMEHLKIAMGFLLAAAAVWLFYVLANQIPRQALAAIQIALLALAGAIWVASQVRGRKRVLPWSAAVLAAAATLLLAGGAKAPATAETAHLLDWQPFDQAQIDELLAEGRTVFVDVTADWCFTCKVNERLVLETEPVASAFSTHEVVAMKADWTHRDDDIADYLASHGRYSVPTYVLYKPGEEPYLFSEIITQDGITERLAE